MPRRKTFSTEESDERLAYALACGQWSNLASCRDAGKLFRHRQQAASFVASKLAEPGFRAKIAAYEKMIGDDETKLSRGRDEARGLNGAWVLLQLRRVYGIAMLDEPAGIDTNGDEVYLPRPNLTAAIRSLSEMARVLGASTEPAEDEDLDAVLAEVRGGRAASH